MTTTIRNATPGDEELLATLNALVHDLHLEKRPVDFRPTSLPELAAWYGSLLQTSGARAWIAAQDGVPVGYVMALVARRAANPFCPAREWWEIDQIAVDPAFRRQGIGRMLLLTAVTEARARGVSHVETQSWAFNQEMHALLRDVGFVPKTIRFELAAQREQQTSG